VPAGGDDAPPVERRDAPPRPPRARAAEARLRERERRVDEASQPNASVLDHAAFLASDEASHATGEVLVVTGGRPLA
jgi:NAD(P)-dependent dehydrogenase (short-subunit alcohol dehydrogenase family)